MARQMPARLGTLATLGARAAAGLLLAAGLHGCGSGSAAVGDAAREARELAHQTCADCAGSVMHTLAQIAKHVYHQGVSSERTHVAFRVIAGSARLRSAVERGDPAAARAAAQALVAGGRLTDLRVLRPNGEVLADVGSPAVAPLRGTIAGSGGAVIGSFVTSVWADDGIVAETNGIAHAFTVVRAQGRSIAGSLPLPRGQLPAKGRLTVKGVGYSYTSIPGERYPAGAVRIYLLRPTSSLAPLCGGTERETVKRTLAQVADAIYAGEGGPRAQTQVRRVQQDAAFGRAVARGDPVATRTAIDNLLTEHIVRLRVSTAGQLLADVGGPYVLAPVRATLRRGGSRIADFVLSIQDDEGYLRLLRRLANIDVLMYMGPRLVKNSLGPSPGSVPAGGLFRYRGRTFNVFTVHARSFPAGPLEIRALIPIPYS
jgi:hypothetical protein